MDAATAWQNANVVSRTKEEQMNFADAGSGSLRGYHGDSFRNKTMPRLGRCRPVSHKPNVHIVKPE